MKNIIIILIIGLFLRIVLSLTTFHPDMQAFNLAGEVIASGNILDIYDYLQNLPDSNPVKNLAVFNYPPAIYIYHGLFNFLFSAIGLSQVNQFLLDNPSNYGNIQFNIHLLLLKIPYLIFDLMIGLILFKLFDSRKQSTTALLLWILNPINLYSTYMMGQFDIIPTFFVVLSVYLTVKRRLELAALSLGFGIAFKLFPLFLVIPLMVFGKSFFERIKIVVLSLIPYIISIIPYLGSSDFRTTALFANQSSKSLYVNIPVSGGESILLFPAVLIVYYLLIYINKVRIDIWKLFMIPLLVFFILTHFHPQWLVWLTPLLIIGLISNYSKHIYSVVLILLTFFASLFFFDPSLTIGIFAPVFPVLHNLPSLWQLMNLNPDYNVSRSLIQTIFVGAALFLIYEYFSDFKEKN